MTTEQPAPQVTIGTVWLVGDVGATNARFGLVSPDGAVLHSSNFACADFAEIGGALDAYLAMRGNLPTPRLGALAIAALITGDQIRMTNHPWSFSVAALRDRFGLERLVAINDFTAVALALTRLTAGDRMAVGGGAPVAGRPIGVLGPGSGLGVSGLIPAGSGWVPLAGEGGHVTMAAANEREGAVLELMRRRPIPRPRSPTPTRPPGTRSAARRRRCSAPCSARLPGIWR